MEKSVKLIENFVSWQGEGPDSGQTMIILRFKTCNLKCPWCDTAVKMRISAEAPHTLSSIQKTIYEKRAGLLITGGEPTVNRHIDETAMLLNELDYPIANVESNGFQLEKLIDMVDLSGKPVTFIYSPKFFNLGSDGLAPIFKKTEKLLGCDNVIVKVVYESKPMVTSYLEWLTNQIDIEDAGKVWLMPEGTNRTDLIRNAEGVFNACERYKFNFSSRSHIIFGFV